MNLLDAREHRDIRGFHGEYRFLSNFWPCHVGFDGMVFHSSENAFQAAKVLDKTQREQFVDCSPAEAKRLGRTVQLRDDWQNVRVEIMRRLLAAKFLDPVLWKRLRATGDAYLEETNTWGDRYWGVDGTGENMLGKLLMALRDSNGLDLQ